MRILVIEDDRSIRETLGIVLESYHYTVNLIEDGPEALRYLQKEWPDVMLLDLTLQGTTGEELHSEIRKRFGRVPPTVVLSASQDGAARANTMMGARFLAKPYTIDQLVSVLEEADASIKHSA